jgi:hypothetical protein
VLKPISRLSQTHQVDFPAVDLENRNLTLARVLSLDLGVDLREMGLLFVLLL